MALKTVEWKNNSVIMIDQTKLPNILEYVTYTDYNQVADAIRTLVVRGAPAIGDIGYVGEEGTEIEVFRVSSPAAEYPRRAIRLGIEGNVKLEFDVDTDGSVLDPYVVESTPAGVFDRASIKAVRKFLYQPPTYNGTSVKVNNVQINLTFKLAN